MMFNSTQQRSSKIKAIREAVPAIVETMEQRMLMSVSTSSGSSIAAIADYSLCATARLGDNGDPYGAAGVVSETSADVIGSSFIEWDGNLANGIDSGLRGFTFIVDTNTGSMSWAVNGAETITCFGNFGTGISQVDLEAAVTGSDMAFAFSGVSVKFYSGSSLVDTETTSGPAVDTIGAQTADAAESLTTVTTDALNCDKVVVTGSVRLQVAQGTAPYASDVFGKIYIHDAT